MIELTYEEFCDLNFEYRTGMTDDWGAIRQYRNDECGIWKHIETKRKRKGCIYSGWHTGTATYYLDGDRREFESFEDLYVAYMEKACEVRVVSLIEAARQVVRLWLTYRHPDSLYTHEDWAEAFEDLRKSLSTWRDHTALLRQALEALENSRAVGNDDDIQGLEIAHLAAIIELRWQLEGEL
jgi:hypothetical protein